MYPRLCNKINETVSFISACHSLLPNELFSAPQINYTFIAKVLI